MKNNEIIVRTETRIRFNEVDSMGIVWHGHYVKLFEDGREAFGDEHGLGYYDFYNQGIYTPLVKISCDFKLPLAYGDTAIIETKYVDSEAAKLIYEYTVYKSSSNEIVATGKSMQVFLNKKRDLILTIPPFFYEWKKKMGLIEE